MEVVRRIGRRGLAGALAIAVATACSDSLGGDDGPEQRLRANRVEWEALGLQNYDYTLRVLCYCLDEVTRPVRVQVRAGTIDSLSYVDNGDPVAVEYRGSFLSIDGLFAKLQDAFDMDADSISVEYDSARHFPRSIAIDYNRQVADEEIGYAASEVVEKS